MSRDVYIKLWKHEAWEKPARRNIQHKKNIYQNKHVNPRRKKINVVQKIAVVKSGFEPPFTA